MPMSLITCNENDMIKTSKYKWVQKITKLVVYLNYIISLVTILNVWTSNYVWMRLRLFIELIKASCLLCLDWLHSSTIRTASPRLSGPSTPLGFFFILIYFRVQSLSIELDQSLLDDFFILSLFHYLNLYWILVSKCEMQRECALWSYSYEMWLSLWPYHNPTWWCRIEYL